MIKPQQFQILLSLADRRRHGLAIRDDILERTHGEMHLWPATLYRSLDKLADRGWIEPTDPPGDEDVRPGQPRYYVLTESGHRALREELERLQGYVAAARSRGVEV